jgi:hypothetical protein
VVRPGVVFTASVVVGQLLVVVLVPILVRLADLAMLALLATTGLVLLYLVIGGIGMLVIWASVVTVFMSNS